MQKCPQVVPPDKSEPIAFDCPGCGAKYIIVTTDVANSVRRREFGCLKCDALFPAGVGRVSLEYVPLDGDANE
jgi:transcription elongation factor Elf1